MSNKHGYQDQESTYSFGRRLRTQPEMLGQFGSDVGELARQAQEDYPATGSLVEEIQAVEALIKGSAAEAAGWYSLFRSAHRRDVERVEDPRKGSQRIESTADVGRAMRDM